MAAALHKTWIAWLLAAAAVAVTLPAQAALVSVPTRFGPDSGTLDTATGLVFLDVDRTSNRSYNAVQLQFGAGGAFAGFRYATTDEVTTMFRNSGITFGSPITSAQQAFFFEVVSALLNISPVDVSGDGEILAYRGLTSDEALPPPFSARRIAELVIDRLSDRHPPSSISIFTGGQLSDDVPASTGVIPPPGSGVRAAGSWLVNTTVVSVPAPSGLALVAAGLAALGWARRANRR